MLESETNAMERKLVRATRAIYDSLPPCLPEKDDGSGRIASQFALARQLALLALTA